MNAHETDLARRNPWRPDGTGIVAGGDVGGDIQAGEAYEVRFVRDDIPGSMVTVRVYAVCSAYLNGDPATEYAYQTQTEYLVCTDPADPGGTEVWSEYSCEDSTTAFETLTDADHAAREATEYLLAHGAQMEEWDGRPEGAWAAQIGDVRATITVTATGSGQRRRYRLEFSKLPGESFGPYEFPDAVGQLRVAALLDPRTARDLVMDAAVNGTATAETG